MSRMILYLAFIYVGHIVTWYIKRYMYLYLAFFRTTGSDYHALEWPLYLISTEVSDKYEPNFVSARD